MSTTVRPDATGAVSLPAELFASAGIAPGVELVAQVEAGRIVVGPAGPTLEERIVARALAMPPDDLPDDLAAQHDHYLYGTPKRPG